MSEQFNGERADVILYGGRVLTLDSKLPEAEAIAVKGERILAVGGDDAIRTLAGRRTQVIALDGRTIIPGIIDAHAHMEREGLKGIRLSLEGANSIAAILERIAAKARVQPKGAWIVTMPVGDPPFYFSGLETIAERRMPSRRELDSVAPDHPVCIMAAFGNWGAPPCYWALNSRALALNGITADTVPQFAEVEIEKNPVTGMPTGTVIESGQRPVAPFDVLKAVPKFTYVERLTGLKESMRLYNAVGTTSVYEGHGSAPETIALYRELYERGDATVRANLTVSPTWHDIAESGRMMRDWLAYARGRGLGDPWLRISGVFVGLLGDTALRDRALEALPDTGWSGFVEPANTLDEFSDLAHLAAENDLRLHTIVSGRMDSVLPVLEKVDRHYPLFGRRWVVEHIDVVQPEHIVVLKRLGISVTAIPAYMLWKNGGPYLDRSDGGEHVTPIRSLIEAGVPIAAGTDNIPISPFHALWAMMVRTERTGGRVIGPDQCLTLDEGLRILTTQGAHLSFEEDVKGSIEPGKFADLAVLSEDLTKISVDKIKEVHAILTMAGGRIVHGEY